MGRQYSRSPGPLTIISHHVSAGNEPGSSGRPAIAPASASQMSTENVCLCSISNPTYFGFHCHHSSSEFLLQTIMWQKPTGMTGSPQALLVFDTANCFPAALGLCECTPLLSFSLSYVTVVLLVPSPLPLSSLRVFFSFINLQWVSHSALSLLISPTPIGHLNDLQYQTHFSKPVLCLVVWFDLVC